MEEGTWVQCTDGSEGEEMGVGKEIEGKKRAEVSQWRESNPI